MSKKRIEPTEAMIRDVESWGEIVGVDDLDLLRYALNHPDAPGLFADEDDRPWEPLGEDAPLNVGDEVRQEWHGLTCTAVVARVHEDGTPLTAENMFLGSRGVGTWRVAPPVGERARLIWSKGATPGMGDLSIPWGTSHEDIHLGGTGWDLASTGHNREPSVITARSTASGASGDATKYGHPTPKPVALMEYLIERCPAGVIADPFAGSGATLVAARNLGRQAIGVELEERYCEVIAKRLSQGAFDFAGL